MPSDDISEQGKVAIKRRRDEAPGIVAGIVQRVAHGEISIERGADELEVAGVVWASGLHHEILRQWSLVGIPPEQFEALAQQTAHEIEDHALEHFSVYCRPSPQSLHTLVLDRKSTRLNSSHLV